MVGAGNLASVLVAALRHAGYGIDCLVARGNSRSLRRARVLAKQVGASASTPAQARISSDVVWFCVPDGAIAQAADSLAQAVDWRGKIALHSSGARTGDALHILRRRGAAVASVHPMMTFVRGSRPDLAGVSFAIEGDSRAVRVARSMVKHLGGRAYAIRQQDKAAYHAWATFASPLLTSLLAVGEQVAAAAGVRHVAAKPRILPMIRQTLANYAAFEGTKAFSGPIVRGDVETVKLHLRALQGMPAARRVYAALADAALEYLPGKNRVALKRTLQSLR